VASGFDAQILIDIPEDTVVHGDVVRLGQALDNLLDNAVRHGEPPIHLSGIVEETEVRIRVSDAGPGIPQSLTPHLFERFAFGGPSGATGLGLYLVREIARGHGGEVEYHPATAGEGPAFEITLPRRSG
jgi:signal transduction histidine kinase